MTEDRLGVYAMAERPPDSLDEFQDHDAVIEAPRSQLVGTLLLHTFVFACLFGIVFFFFALMNGSHGHDNIGPFSLPLVLGFAISAVPIVYKVVLSRHSFPLAVAVSVLVIGIYSLGIGWLFVGLGRFPITDVNIFWHLAGVALWGLLAAGVGAFWPGVLDSKNNRHQSSVDPRLSDQDWEKQSAAHLRARGDMTDAHVRDLLAEARQEASEGGASLVSLFGPPSEYARRPAAQRGVAARRQALLWTAITVLPVWNLVRHVLDEGWSWDLGVLWSGLWLLAAATAAILSWRISLQHPSSRSGTGEMTRPH